MAYYNEVEKYPVRWLKNLVRDGRIASGMVDGRSIHAVCADDIPEGQAHFFAGIGIWSCALRMAGVDDESDVWTGSCPCQPFSVAGKGKGVDDERHLWPVWLRLIRQRLPTMLFGEQVASPSGRRWLATVQADLEALGYRFAAADLCAAGVGAPHIRQRLFFGAVRLADGDQARQRSGRRRQGAPEARDDARRGCDTGRLGNTDEERTRWDSGAGFSPKKETKVTRAQDWRKLGDPTQSSGTVGRLDNSDETGLEGHRAGEAEKRRKTPKRPDQSSGVSRSVGLPDSGGKPRGQAGLHARDSAKAGQEKRARQLSGAAMLRAWRPVEYALCADGKARPLKPGLVPLVDGYPGRVDEIKAYGNAIVPQVAAAFVVSFLASVAELEE